MYKSLRRSGTYLSFRAHPFCRRLERPQRHVPAAGPIDGFRDGMVERWNGTRQNHGTAGNREAGGFVNSAVKHIRSILVLINFIWFVKILPLLSRFSDCRWIQLTVASLALEVSRRVSLFVAL